MAIVDNKETNKKDDNVFKILVVILVIAIIATIGYWLLNRNNLKSDDEKVKELHNYFSTDYLNNCEGLVNYTDKKVDYKSIKSENKLCLAYHKADLKNAETETWNKVKNKDVCTKDNMTFATDDEKNTCTVTIVDKKIVNDVYKKIFGVTVEDTETFKIDSHNVCYAKDDKYYCGISENYVITLGNESSIYRVIQKATEKSSELVIYDYFIKMNDATCYKYYTPTTKYDACTKEYQKNQKVNYDFLKKYGTYYKHTYSKAEDGSYYWVSSEPVK